MRMNILDVKDLTVIINNNVILDRIDLSVEKGELLGILGPNGAGKTTFFKAILGLIDYDGSISIFNYKDSERIKVLPFISYLPQKINIDNNFPVTVNDLISTAFIQLRYMRKHKKLLEKQGYEWSDYDISIDKVLDIVGLKNKKDVRLGNLSGGELQRALIAKVLICKSPLLILDEPFTALDADAQNMLSDLLKMLNEEYDITVILAAHDLLLLLELANNIVCMNKKIFFHGSKDECMNNDMLKYYSESAMHFHMEEHE